MLKTKLSASAIEYYGTALSQINKAIAHLDEAFENIERSKEFLEDQEQMMKRFKMDSSEAKDLKNEVNVLLKQLSKFSDFVDTVAISIDNAKYNYSKED